MSVTMEQDVGGKVLLLQVSEKLTKEDYERFVPEFDKAILNNKKIRLLFEMKDFRGWDAKGLWEDLKVDFKHASDIERIAMIGDKAWEKAMSYICKPFTSAEIRFFQPEEREKALEWLYEGLPVPPSCEACKACSYSE
jgi:ABC-type sulfate transport system substrate-binding protein